MTEDEGVLEAARAIRPYLADLVGAAAADTLDRRIARQLNRPASETERVAALRALLEEQEDTRWFLTEVLADTPHHRPPYHQTSRAPSRGRLPSPYGDPAPVGATMYVCPYGDFTWYQPEVGVPVPSCSTSGHGKLRPRGGDRQQPDAAS